MQPPSNSSSTNTNIDSTSKRVPTEATLITDHFALPTVNPFVGKEQSSEEYPNHDKNNSKKPMGWLSQSGNYATKIYSVTRDSSQFVFRKLPSFWKGEQQQSGVQLGHSQDSVTSRVTYHPTNHLNNWFNIPYYSINTGGQNRNQRPNNSLKNVRRLLRSVHKEEGLHKEEKHDFSIYSRGRHRGWSWSWSVDSLQSLSMKKEDKDWFEEDSVASSADQHGKITSSFSSSDHPNNHQTRHRTIANAETASRLGEGTVVALRDLVLDEALDLHYALRYWTLRLDRPFLYYLESGGPFFGENGVLHHHHHPVGEKVSRLQSLLAKRCSNIGELQQHLWRAGWQRGVREWGILGQGSEFAAVAGWRGGIIEESDSSTNPLLGMRNYRSGTSERGVAGDSQGIKINGPALAAWSVDAIRVVRDHLYRAGGNHCPLPYFEHWPREEIHFLDGDGNVDIIQNDKNDADNRNSKNLESIDGNSREVPSAILTDSMFSVDAAKVFKNESLHYPKQNITKNLPTWAATSHDTESTSTTHQSRRDFDSNKVGDTIHPEKGILPISTTSHIKVDAINNQLLSQNSVERNDGNNIVITDLTRMASEVNEILNSMEVYMKMQRKRRMDKLKPPSRLMRNWYVAVVTAPLLTYIGYKLTKGNVGIHLAKEVYKKIAVFCAEHISEPLQSIFQELFTRKGRQDVTDRKARQDVIESLKIMIKSWLDENHPKISEVDRSQMAASMDMSLIEVTKEHAIENILEINNIVRMSLIEMQFIKKEMMNALFAMDELMGSNEINMKLAAMTPAFLLFNFMRYISKKLFYALLKIGKSKEETYSSIRHVILDIERLLVMRDDPPTSPPLLTVFEANHRSHRETQKRDQGKSYPKVREEAPSIKRSNNNRTEALYEYPTQYSSSYILNSDDLGMLMLLIHECRTILWQNRRRFSRKELQNVLEDLAELAGERGAVSVRQQLRIIARMCRTYSFLKVVSSGIPFSINDDFVAIR